MWPRPRGRGICFTGPVQIVGTLASMWPRPRPWNRGHCTRTSRADFRFNVATAARPWNQDAASGADGGRRASMWPRPRGRGIERLRVEAAARLVGFNVAKSRALVFLGFNVATAARPWNRARHAALVRVARASRGRGRAAVESLKGERVWKKARPLQCGHGRAAVESRVGGGHLQCAVQLHVATAARPWNQCKENGRRVRLSGFNVATAARPWNQRCHSSEIHQSGSFNVATAARPWNLPRRADQGR